jgi:hypothetical protein
MSIEQHMEEVLNGQQGATASRKKRPSASKLIAAAMKGSLLTEGLGRQLARQQLRQIGEEYVQELALGLPELFEQISRLTERIATPIHQQRSLPPAEQAASRGSLFADIFYGDDFYGDDEE